MGFNSKYTGAQVEAWLDNIKNYSANDILEKLKTVDGSNSGLDADLLDGKHLSDILASNVASATRSRYLETLAYTGNQWYGDSYRMYGQWASDNSDYLDLKVDKRYVRVDVAKKLNTARTIWGQSFDGTGNVSGNIIGVGSISPEADSSYNIGAASSQFRWIYANGVYAKTGSYLGFGANNTDHIRILTNGNVGIGTTNPGYKLDVNGDIHTSGTLTQNSDIRLKNINKDILLSIEDIANAPLFEFIYKSDEDKRIHVGTSAQYWIERNNWFCKKQDNGYYDMEIQNLSLASAISIAKEFKKYKEETESTISSMKKEIQELKQIVLNMNK